MRRKRRPSVRQSRRCDAAVLAEPGRRGGCVPRSDARGRWRWSGEGRPSGARRYRQDGLFVNAELVRQGYAMVAMYPPNVKCATCFREMQAEAREAGRGLWAWRLYVPVAGDVGWCIDLNTATHEVQQQIVQIRPARATAIIEGRPWASVDDLLRTNGIGPSRLADIKAQGLACVRW